MPSPGLQNLRHIVVLMMENRSFDHLLGGMKAIDPRIDGLTGSEANLDANDAPVAGASRRRHYQGQLDPDPNHHFPAVDLPALRRQHDADAGADDAGLRPSYYEERRDVQHSRKIMYYFKPEKLPVLTTLATEFALVQPAGSRRSPGRRCATAPSPTTARRLATWAWTSSTRTPVLSIYQRLHAAGRTAKIYYFDQPSSTMEVVNLLQHQPQFFGTFDDFLADCTAGTLPDYAFVEPNYSDHDGPGGGALLASDQHPDHRRARGRALHRAVYNAIQDNPALWESTALLLTYDEHGGIYDHVPPPDAPRTVSSRSRPRRAPASRSCSTGWE